MLMDPRVRSFRIRAALGRCDFTGIYTELPFEARQPSSEYRSRVFLDWTG